MTAKICAAIGRSRHRMMMAEHKALADKGAELVEFRVDYIARTPDLARLLKDRPTPVVITCRRASDRGRWKGSEEDRQKLLRTAIISGADYVDLEDDVAGSIRRYGKTKRIVSHHNFEETPDNLAEIHARMCKLDPDVVKIVTMANSPTDCVRMMQLVAKSPVPTAGFCMGEMGMLTRILCGKYGSPFTYATFNKDRELAPGQFSFDEMRNIFRFEQLNAETRVFGVIGDPIAHSFSPLLHNTAMQKIGFNGVYLPLRIPADALGQTLDQFEWFNIEGYSVTIPHKEAVLAKYPNADDFVREIGAANTVHRDDRGKWKVSNTDYTAAMESLATGLRPGETLEGKRVLMLGAGGAARAIGLGVKKAGGVLVVTSRTSKRAVALADSLGVKSVTWENRGSEFADILVNCTPVGMHPNVNETPFQANWLRDDMLVFDTIYNPEQTLLIKEAREHSCRTVTGIEMFVRQAAAQFQMFTGQPAPVESLRDTLRRGISPVKY